MRTGRTNLRCELIGQPRCPVDDLLPRPVAGPSRQTRSVRGRLPVERRTGGGGAARFGVRARGEGDAGDAAAANPVGAVVLDGGELGDDGHEFGMEARVGAGPFPGFGHPLVHRDGVHVPGRVIDDVRAVVPQRLSDLAGLW
jgi:hypothetical protein